MENILRERVLKVIVKASRVMDPHEKRLITQRAFPPIPYSSKRGIGTSDVPGGYLNLDWE